MKIFNVENGSEVVYVQKKDILSLQERDECGLLNIKEKMPEALSSFMVYKNPETYVVEGEEEEFICFEGKDVVDYLKKIDYIIDVNEYINNTISDLYHKAVSNGDIAIEANDDLNKYKRDKANIFDPNRETPKVFLSRLKILNDLERTDYEHWYISKELFKIINIKRGKVDIPFPKVLTCEELIIDIDGVLYCITNTLDPNTVHIGIKSVKRHIPYQFNVREISLCARLTKLHNEILVGEFEESIEYIDDYNLMLTFVPNLERNKNKEFKPRRLQKMYNKKGISC